MNNRINEFDNFFDGLDLDDERSNINSIKKNVKRKVRIHRTVTAVRNMALGFVFLCGVTVIGVNTNSAFADAVSRLPFIGQWISQTEDDGFKAAIENDYETIVNKTVNIKSGKVTIPYCVVDESNFVFAISGEFENNKTIGTVLHVSITNLDNNETREYSHQCTRFGKNFETLQTCEIFDWLYDEDNKWEYPSKVRLTLELGIDNPKTDDYENEKVEYEIELKEAAEAKEIDLNKDFTVENQKFTINRAVIYPTCTKVYYREDEANSMECVHINFSLKSKDGKMMETKHYSAYSEELEGEECYVLESGYYTMGEDFDIILNEAYFLSKDNKVITLDTKTNQFYDANGIVTDIYIPEKNDDELNEYLWDACEFDDGTPIVVPNASTKSEEGTCILSSLDFLSGDEYEEEFISSSSGGLEEYEEVVWAEIPNEIIKNDSDGKIKFEKAYPEVCCYPNIVVNR